jgi:hypothetical protein
MHDSMQGRSFVSVSHPLNLLGYQVVPYSFHVLYTAGYVQYVLCHLGWMSHSRIYCTVGYRAHSYYTILVT